MGNKRKKNKSTASALIATIIVAVLATAAIIALLIMPEGKNNNESDGGSSDATVITFKPSKELIEECGAKAQELIKKNYTAVRLFISEGLPHLDEPYGNRPEDGYFTAASDEYKAFEDIEKLVREIYVEEEAERILTNMPADPEAALKAEAGEVPERIAVYANREMYVDMDDPGYEFSQPQVPDVYVPGSPTYVKIDVLGINESFRPYSDYKRPWGSISIKIDPVRPDECGVTVYLGSNENINLSSIEDTDVLNVTMVKTDGEWRLTKMIY